MKKHIKIIAILLIVQLVIFCSKENNRNKQTVSSSLDNGGLNAITSVDDDDKQSVPLPRIMVTDVGNHRLVGFDDMDGTNWVTYYGEPKLGITFRTLGGVSVDAQNRIYFSDYTYEKGMRSRIVRIDDVSGNGLTIYEAPENTIGGIDVDESGRIYYHNKNQIVRIDNMDGKNRVTFKPDEPISSGDVKIGKDKFIYFTNFKYGTLYKMKDMTGAGLERLYAFKDDVGPDGLPMPKKTGLATIAFSPEGKIYSTSWFRSLILEFSDMDDNTPDYCDINTQLCDFRRPSGIAVDSKGRIYSAEFDGSRILRMDNVHGDDLVTFGEPGIGIGQFSRLHVIWTNL